MLSILALLYGAAVLTGVQASCITSFQEATWNFVPDRDSSHLGVPTVESCQELCSSHPGCQGYTWRFDAIFGYSCYEYQELDGLHACAGCYSGTVPIAHDGACVFSPENLVGTVSSESLEDCYQSCTETDGCQGYTWYGQATSLPNICFQLTDCSSVIPCQGCSSGELRCSGPPQCQPGGYRVLDDPTRNEDYGKKLYCDNIDGEHTTSSDWQGPGYYRMQAPAGDKIPTSSPGEGHCGTTAPGWINDEEGAIQQMEIGEEINVKVCFDYNSDPCIYDTEIRITLCPGEYFVYFLPNTPVCNLRYCGTF